MVVIVKHWDFYEMKIHFQAPQNSKSDMSNFEG
jgi:hypothetical protein